MDPPSPTSLGGEGTGVDGGVAWARSEPSPRAVPRGVAVRSSSRRSRIGPLARSALGPPTLMWSRPGGGVGMGVGRRAGGAGTWGAACSFRKTSAGGRNTAGPRGSARARFPVPPGATSGCDR